MCIRDRARRTGSFGPSRAPVRVPSCTSQLHDAMVRGTSAGFDLGSHVRPFRGVEPAPYAVRFLHHQRVFKTFADDWTDGAYRLRRGFTCERRLGPRSASGEKKLSGSTWRHLPSYCHSYSSISGLGSRAMLAIGLTRTAHRKLADVEVAGAKTRLAIGEVELPHAAECFIEALSANRLPVGVESVPPHAQGRRIVLAEFKAVVYAQLRVSGQRRIDRLDRGDEPAGEDVLLDPAIRIASGEVAVMLHQNGLNDHPATRRQQPVDRREIRRPILFADGLDHLDADDRVIDACDLPVVDQLEIDVDTGFGKPLTRKGGLFRRNRDCGDLRAALRGPDGERSPATPDLKNTCPVAHVGEVEDRIHFAQLCRLQVLACAVEERRRVRQGGIQELCEQFVGQVVVALDVAARAVDGVAFVPRQPLIHESPETLQGFGDEVCEALGEWGQEVGEIGVRTGRPVAGHVCLTETDLCVFAQPSEERSWTYHAHLGRIGPGVTPDGAIGERQPYVDAVDRRAHNRLGYPSLRRCLGGARYLSLIHI